MHLMREYLNICISAYMYVYGYIYIQEGILGGTLPKRETSLDRYVDRTDRRMKLGFTAVAVAAGANGGVAAREGARWKIPICCRGPAGSISSSVVPFGFLDDITLGDGNNARFDRAFVDE